MLKLCEQFLEVKLRKKVNVFNDHFISHMFMIQDNEKIIMKISNI